MHLLNAEVACIDQFEHYDKQSYRNRCKLLSANGVLDLSIPVHKTRTKELVKNIRLSKTQRWRSQHWSAIASAYGKAPYFEYFAEEIKMVYAEEYDFLVELNTCQVNLILKILRFPNKITYSEKYIPLKSEPDLRELIHPKISSAEDLQFAQSLELPYYQSFGEKFEFQKNLSILDLLFNKGLETKTYLLQSKH